ncbi:MAG: hypothetical protein LBD75_06795 [Candidatus Peribacteria bacterium]|nr:hypothetical protein [Candidatus Peribacteria bacterium]
MLAMNDASSATITENNEKTHVMIITHSYHDTNQYYNGTPRYKISGHTNDRQDVDLVALLGRSYVQYHTIGVHITY